MWKKYYVEDECFGGIERGFITRPTNIVRVDGKRYKMVERKAKKGELILVTDDRFPDLYDLGGVYSVIKVTDYAVVIHCKLGDEVGMYEEDYRVLEPIENSRGFNGEEGEDKLLDITANLARRVASLEEQLVDAQNNIEMLGREVAEVKSSLPREASNNKAKYPKKLTSDLEKLKALLNTDDANVTLVELTEQLDETLYLTFKIEGCSFEASGIGVDHDE